MDEDAGQRVSVEVTPAEAKLIITALHQFEPYWPAGMDDLDRTALLAEVRGAIDHVVASLDAPS